MAVLVFAETIKLNFKKAAFESINYGKKLAEMLGTECIALCLGNVDNAAILGKYGADKVIQVNNSGLNHLDSQVFSKVISSVAEKIAAQVIVLSHSSTGKSLIGRLAVRLNAGSVTGVVSLPDLSNGFLVKKGVFSGKAFANYNITSEVKVLSLMGNSFPVEILGEEVSVEFLEVEVPKSHLSIEEAELSDGQVPLPEAELVVSAGRGMKEPGNWGIIEDLAESIGATTACSRPVSDSGWRPHHEHVGQTGIAIRPNLYIAIGISGAIQHLAGVNNSKVIVVINKDPEAPFFKAADYGVCADLFDVVPKLTEAFKGFKAQS